MFGARLGVGLGAVEAGAEVSGALASAPSVSVAVSAYPIAGVATAGKGAGSRCWLVDASVAVEGDGRSIAAIGLAEVLCLRLGAELQLPGANGEMDGGVAGGEGADAAGEREGLAARGVVCAAGVRAPAPLATPLSSSSMGSRRCA